jgi:hypothetical protein
LIGKPRTGTLHGRESDSKRIKVSMAQLGKTISILVAFGATGAAAQTEETANQAPVVVEFFTSQACSSCVTAGALFNDIAAQEDVIALGWHVDYWNMLATKRGQWVDPYSSADWSKRQRKYNINIRQRSSVYTPQIVVDGAYEVIGSSKEKVAAIIETATDTAPAMTIAGKREGDEILFNIGESENGGNAYLVHFRSKCRDRPGTARSHPRPGQSHYGALARRQ